MSELIPYQEIKLENQSVDEIVEDIGILKKIEEASKFEIGRRLVYLNETCKHGEYLPKLKEVGINQSEDSRYRNFFLRFGKYDNCHTLGTGKIRELLRIPDGKEEEYLNKISDPNEVTAKQLREEIEKLKQEKEQEKLAREALINSNKQLQEQLEKKKVEYKEIPTAPDDYDEVKCKSEQYEEERRKNVELGKMISDLQQEKMNIRYEYDKRIKEVEDKYTKIQEQLKEMDLEEDKLYKYVRQDKELGSFVGDIQTLLLDRLASFKYSAYLDDDVNKYNVDMLAKLINQIRRWCDDIEEITQQYTEEYEEHKKDDNVIEICDVEVS